MGTCTSEPFTERLPDGGADMMVIGAPDGSVVFVAFEVRFDGKVIFSSETLRFVPGIRTIPNVVFTVDTFVPGARVMSKQ